MTDRTRKLASLTDAQLDRLWLLLMWDPNTDHQPPPVTVWTTRPTRGGESLIDRLVSL